MTLLVALLFARSDIVIADFEQATYGAWTTTGTAFGTGPVKGTLPNQMQVTGFRGKGLVNSYVGGDGSTGTLASPPFVVERKYINFLIGGGNQPDKTCVNLIVDGKTVHSVTGKSTTPQDTENLAIAAWDVSQWQGKTARIEIVDNATGGWGHINVDDIIQSDEQAKPPKPEPLYRETYRPQFHFTAQKNWLNDPNGLVFFEGEYHLFFQHNPGGIQWGNMSWGHAVSKDLFHWKELPVALLPDEKGTMYSGSAAVDTTNSAGFDAPLVALYTAAGKPFTQCLAYSKDKGRTWTKYSGNPVLGHVAGENRDPRIFWHVPTKQWIMALYLDGDEFAIYGSPDLKTWKELSRLNVPGSSECPELFEVPLIGSNDTRWVFYGGNCRYIVGSFDGKTFKPEIKPFQLDYGQFYASQTYNNAPEGRRIQIGWMNGAGPYPNMPFNQQMSVPCDLALYSGKDDYVLTRNPVKEIERLYGLSVHAETASLPGASRSLGVLGGGLYDIQTEFHFPYGGAATFDIGGHPLVIDASKSLMSFQGKVAPLRTGSVDISVRVLVDWSSVEIFAQGGSVTLSAYLPVSDVLPKKLKVKLSGNDNIAVKSMHAYELKSAW